MTRGCATPWESTIGDRYRSDDVSTSAPPLRPRSGHVGTAHHSTSRMTGSFRRVRPRWLVGVGNHVLSGIVLFACADGRPGRRRWEKTCQYISMALVADGIEVWHDNFTAATPAGDIAMTNVIGIVPGESSSVVVVGGHYDTARLEGIRFVGANDGGSSTALLLELARVLAGRKNRLTYWVVFFDGEEALERWSDKDSLYGSRHMVEQLADDGRLKKIRDSDSCRYDWRPPSRYPARIEFDCVVAGSCVKAVPENSVMRARLTAVPTRWRTITRLSSSEE